MNIASRGATMAVDWEQRIDFAKLRTDRLQRAQESLRASSLGAMLLFDQNNIRYVTSTHIGEWARDKSARCALLTREGDPVLWDFGSAAKHHRLYCPWLPPENVRGGMIGLRGAVAPDAGLFSRAAREIAEMVRYAVGYQSRAFVTFGAPINLEGYDAESRSAIMALAHHIRETIGRLHKVLPTAVLAAALKPSITRRELEARAEAIVETVRAAGGNMGVTSGRQAIEEGAEPLAARNIIHVERGGRFRVR